jgi:hypothetical protein
MPLPIYKTSSTQVSPLGSEYRLGSERVFRYAKNGSAALVAGTVLQATRPNTSHDNLTCAAAAAKATSITVTLGSAPVGTDEYAEGYVYTNDQAGEGYVYDIIDHPWALASGTLKLAIKDDVVVALTTSSQATLLKNVYDGVNRPFGDPWDIICGIAPMAVPANHYFWCQVRGPAVVLQAGGLFAGRGVMLSQWKPGAVEVLKQVVPIYKESAGRELRSDNVSSEAMQFQQKGIEQRIHVSGQQEDDEVLTSVAGKATIPERGIGYCINPRVSTEYALVYLTIS